MLNRVGDVARALGESTVTIRYWCEEFGVPTKRSKGGQRWFDSSAVAAIGEVRRLLRVEGFTLAGAKKKLGIQ